VSTIPNRGKIAKKDRIRRAAGCIMPNESLLQDRDYTVIVAKSSPSTPVPPPGYERRWMEAHDAIVQLTQQCEAFDPDGITIYVSCHDLPANCFRRYDDVLSGQLETVLNDNYPPKTLNLLDALKVALEDYFMRKATGTTKANGELILVLIDGEPRDRSSIAKEIAAASHQLESGNELGIGFAQVGDDLIARGFLNALDQDLKSQAGAKFDIVYTRALDEIKPECLTEFLMHIVEG
jgi:hypothetical protein